MKILVDTNVILDALLEREPFVDSAVAILNGIEGKKMLGYLAGTTVTTIFYLTQRSMTEKKARAVIENLLSLFNIAPIDHETLTSALKNDFKDYEDGVLHEAALGVKVDAIITRNIKDFKNSKCPVFVPTEFLAMQGNV